MAKAELSETVCPREVALVPAAPLTEHEEPSTSLRNVYYFYTETLSKIIS